MSYDIIYCNMKEFNVIQRWYDDYDVKYGVIRCNTL